MSLAFHVRLIVGFPVSRDDFHDADDKPTAAAVAYANRYGIAPSDAWEVALDRHVHCFDPVYGWDHCPPTRYAMGSRPPRRPWACRRRRGSRRGSRGSRR
jgi:hypothetical protein